MPGGYKTGQTSLIFAEIENLEPVVRRLQMFRGDWRTRSLRAAEKISDLIVEEMRAEAPIGLSGKLRQNIVRRIHPRGDGFVVEVVSGMFYTKWVIYGRGWVYPKRRKVLRWVSYQPTYARGRAARPATPGPVVFARRAGPTQPNPFHLRGWERAEQKVIKEWGQLGAEVGEALALTRPAGQYRSLRTGRFARVPL